MSANAITKLKSLCKQNFMHPAVKDPSSGAWTLICKEKDKGATLKVINISGLEEVVAFKYDEIGLRSNFFNNGHDTAKACDALVFCLFEGQYYILIFDMKSSIPSDGKVYAQLRSGLCAAKYLNSVLDIFEQVKDCDWIYRYLVFHCDSNKRATYPADSSASQSNDVPEKPSILKVVDGETISIRKILGLPLMPQP